MIEFSELRATLIRLLEDWQRESLTSREFHSAIETLWEGKSDWPDLPKTDPNSTLVEALAHLDVMNHQYVLRKDIDAILAFIEGGVDQPAEAWKRWEAYWNGIHYDQRKNRFHTEYGSS